MKEMFLNNSIRLIGEYSQIDSEEKKEKLLYGLEGIYLTITKLFIIFLLSIIFGILKEVLIVLAFYNFLRFFGFGFHASTSTECLVISTTLFLLLPYLVVNHYIVLNNSLAIGVLCFINFLLFAPADTVKRPMINKKKKLYRKIALLCTTIIFITISLLSNYYICSLILLALIFQMLMVSPITYKLFGQPYNNYKNYKA